MKVSYYDTDLIIDCGENWLSECANWDVHAIVVTHAHPDHAFGLKEGAPCPVFATEESWEALEGFDVEERRVMPKREPVSFRKSEESLPVTVEAFPVLHSTRAPAVGYRVSARAVEAFYVPDVAWVQDREAALSGVRVYIGDGATVSRSMVRKPGGVIIGHVQIRTQLTWCQELGVPRAVFTHLGSEVRRARQRGARDCGTMAR